MEVGVRNVKWRLVGAWTTGSAMKKAIFSDKHKIQVIKFYSHGRIYEPLIHLF